jgi:hypothetical protein
MCGYPRQITYNINKSLKMVIIMKDWFYTPGSEIVISDGAINKSKIVLAIKRGFHSIASLKTKFGFSVTSEESEDLNYLIKIFKPLSYENQSGCKGCDGCSAKPNAK